MKRWSEAMLRALGMLVVTTAMAAIGARPAPAQTPEEFYRGKDVRILIGAELGGTFGLYAQLAAQFMRKHLPGQPNLIVQSMPGAGGITAIYHSYNAAPKDGTLMHLLHNDVALETLLTPGVKFNAREYRWIGRFADAENVGLVSRRSGVTSLDDARRREVSMGATGTRNMIGHGPLAFNRFAGTRFKVIAGYKGTGDVSLAVDRGEVDGVALPWAGALAIHADKLRSGDLSVIFALAAKRIAEVPHAPAITEFAQDEDARTFLAIYTSGGTIGRALVVPPGVPQDRVAALRAAFDKTVKDPELIAHVKEKRIIFSPMGGAELESYVAKLVAAPPDRVEAARKTYAELLK